MMVRASAPVCWGTSASGWWSVGMTGRRQWNIDRAICLLTIFGYYQVFADQNDHSNNLQGVWCQVWEQLMAFIESHRLRSLPKAGEEGPHQKVCYTVGDCRYSTFPKAVSTITRTVGYFRSLLKQLYSAGLHKDHAATRASSHFHHTHWGAGRHLLAAKGTPSSTPAMSFLKIYL